MIEDYHLTTPEEEIEYFYEDIVDEGSEDPWQPQQDNFTPAAETYYVTDGE